MYQSIQVFPSLGMFSKVHSTGHRSYKAYPVSLHNFLSVFCSTFSFFKSNCSSLITERLNISQKEHCDQLILHSSPVCAGCTAHTVHMSTHCSELIICFKPQHILAPLFVKNDFLLLRLCLPFFAGD